jgi:predicted RNA-binding Zn-ribbon protein involved in translation (DUF1610 family)
MALKRTSKSMGKPVGKPMTSAVRHVEVLAKRLMTAGGSYEGWLCKSKTCGLVIAIAPAPAGSKPIAAEPEDRLVALKCPHCGDEDLYRWNYRSEHPYQPKE